MVRFKQTTDARIGRHARHAADIMEERGWVQRQLQARTGEVCLLGAFELAVRPMGELGAQLRTKFNMRFDEWMEEHYAGALPVTTPWLRAAAWNDETFKSKEEAVSWLRKFADDLDPQRV